jgi:hypothetical protein
MYLGSNILDYTYQTTNWLVGGQYIENIPCDLNGRNDILLTRHCHIQTSLMIKIQHISQWHYPNYEHNLDYAVLSHSFK